MPTEFLVSSSYNSELADSFKSDPSEKITRLAKFVLNRTGLLSSVTVCCSGLGVLAWIYRTIDIGTSDHPPYHLYKTRVTCFGGCLFQ